jgi:hypothetical protein
VYCDHALETAPHAGGHEGLPGGKMRLSLFPAVFVTVSINVGDLSQGRHR